MANIQAAVRFNQYFKSAADLLVKQCESPFPKLQPDGLDPALPAGLHRGSIAEIYGRRSSGRTSVAFKILAEATRAGEMTAVVDLQDNFCPASAARTGVRLEQVIWAKCGGNAEHAMQTSDLLLHAGGFGLVILDLCEANARTLNRIPLSYWHRFQRAIEQTPTVLLVCADSPQAKTSRSIHLQMKVNSLRWAKESSFARLHGIESRAVHDKISNIHPRPLFFQSVV